MKGTAKTRKITYISVDRISEPTEQVRSVMVQESLEDLARSIKQVGVIEPIVVVKTENGYEVVAGHRRLLAAKMAELTYIPAQILEQEEIDPDEVKLHENIYREELNPADEGEFYTRLYAEKKLTMSQIATKVGKSVAYVKDRLDLVEGDPAVLEALRGGHIKASIAKELNAISDERTRRYYLHCAIETGASLSTVRQWRWNWEKEEAVRQFREAGGREVDLPKALPKYYYSCPMCEQPTEVERTMAISVCDSCYEEIIEAFSLRRKEEEVGR